MEKIGENRFFTDLFSLHIYLTQSLLRGKSAFQIFPLSFLTPSLPLSFVPLCDPHIFIRNTPFSVKPISCCKHRSAEQRATFSSKPPTQLQWFWRLLRCPSFRVGHPPLSPFPFQPLLIPSVPCPVPPALKPRAPKGAGIAQWSVSLWLLCRLMDLASLVCG